MIIDILTKATEPWALIGYQLEDGPYYQRMTADAAGGLTFTTVSYALSPWLSRAH